MSVQPSTWTLVAGRYLKQVAIGPTNQFQVAIQYDPADNFVVYSRDFGATWTPSTGITGNVNCISSNGYNVLVGVNSAASHLYFSENYGTTFTALSNSPTSYWTVVGVSQGGNHMVACDYTGDAATIHYTTNGGNSWSSLNSYSGAIITSGAWSTFDSMNTMYFVGYLTSSPYYSGLFITTDQGETWNTLPGFTYNLGGVACDETGQYVVVTASQDGVYRSTNYGANWTKTSAPSSAPTGPNMGSIVCDRTGNHIVVMDVENLVLYASSDAGQSWILQTTAGSNTASDVFPLSMSPDGSYQYASFMDLGLYSLIVPAYKTVNFSNGMYTPLSFVACDSTCENIVAVGSTTYGDNKCIVYSSDNGLTWNLSDADSSGDSIYTCLAASASGQYVVAGFENGPHGVVFSNNYGVNFNIVTTGLNFIPSAIAISNDGEKFYATTNDGSGEVYVGTVSGDVVVKNIGVSGMYWKSIACDSTGQYVYATARDDYTPYYLYQSEFATPYIHLPLNGSTVDVMEHSTVTVTGSINYVSGVSSQYAMNLANNPSGGASNYVTATWTGSSSFTMSFWFNAQSVNTQQVIVGAYNGQFQVILLGDNRLVLYVPIGGGDIIISYTPGITINTWYQVTLTFQQSGLCSMYVNGSLVGTYRNSSSFSSTSSGIFSIGCQDDSRTQAFNGYISDFRLYESAGNYGTWKQMSSCASSPLLPLSVACDSTGDVVTVTAGTDGVYQSTNGGTTWDLKSVLTTSKKMIRPNHTGLSGSSTTTWANDGVNWSSTQSSTYTTFYSYYAFNNTLVGNTFASDVNYVGGSGQTTGSSPSTSVIGVGNVLGDWIQIGSSIPLVMYSYTFSCGGTIPYQPRTYIIIGSNDATNWYPIQSASFSGNAYSTHLTSWNNDLLVNVNGTQTVTAQNTVTATTTTYSTTTTPYLYFRAIATSTYSEIFEIGEWYINFVPSTLATIVPQLTGLSSESWSSNGVKWNATASSALVSAGYYGIYYAFNNFIEGGYSAGWACANPDYNGSYNGSVSTTVLGVGAVAGEWLQIQSSVPLVMQSYLLQELNVANLVLSYLIVGSMDGAAWYPIQQATYQSNPYTDNHQGSTSRLLANYTGTQTVVAATSANVSTTSYATSSNAYLYFRVIGTTLFPGSNYFETSEWDINFLPFTTTYGIMPPYIELPLTNSVVDIKGNSTVTANGSITYVTGEVGTYAARISNTAAGTANNYIQGSFTYVPNFTVTGRFDIYSLPMSDTSTIFSMGTNIQTCLAIQYCQNANLFGSSYFTGLVVWGYNSSNQPFVIGTQSISNYSWYSFQLVYEEMGIMSVYLNNELFGSIPGVALLATPTTYRIGSITHAALNAFDGAFTDLRIYNVSLAPPTGRSIRKVASDSTGENLLVVDYNHDIAFRSSDSGASWASQIVNGTGTNEIKCISIDSSGTYAFASYYNSGAFMSQRSSGLTTSWTVRNGTYYPVMTFSNDNVYQTAISSLYGFTSTGHSVISYSTNSGSTWTQGPDMNGFVTGLAANATGQYVVAVLEMNLSASPSVYRSTNYGATFTELSNSPDYQQTGINCITCDSTGQYLYAGAYDGNIYVSSNAGVDWATRTMPDFVSNIICSHSGQYVYALVNDQVCISTNHGQTWSAPIDISLNGCSQIACDWTGQYIVAACYNDGVYRSTNYGQTWTKTSAPSTPAAGGAQNYYYISCNSTGNRIITFDINNGTTYVSTNAGATWTLQYTPDSQSNEAFMGVSISPDGTRYTTTPWATGTYSLTAGSPDIPNAIPCFLQGTKILCQIEGVETYVNVEAIRPGTLVKTSRDGYKAVKLIGHRDMTNPGTVDRNKNSLYLCTKDAYPEITEDLTITGCHAILVNKISEEQRAGIIATLQRVFVTDKKYRLPACVDERAAVVQTSGTFTVWHFALEHYDTRMNYGVYAQGLLVESSPICHMNSKNYTLV